MKRIRLVCATRVSAADFPTMTLLGRSLNYFLSHSSEFELRLFPDNKLGLPILYNQAIDEVRDSPRILVFIHDDVHFLDIFWPATIREGLACFDLIGVVGTKRHYSRQVSWIQYLSDDGMHVGHIEKADASGAIGHIKKIDSIPDPGQREITPGGSLAYLDYQLLSSFGPSRQQVCLLDGVLLACNSDTLIDHHLRFDESFDFHFYDMDLCRQFEKNALRMGTWPISLLHGSYGSYDSRYIVNHSAFVAKWG
jgi:hypothetical protein